MINDESTTEEGTKGFRPPASITLTLEPGGKVLQFPWPKTVARLLNKLEMKQGTVLVIRDGELLTPDRRIAIDDAITVRGVVSRG